MSGEVAPAPVANVIDPEERALWRRREAGDAIGVDACISAVAQADAHALGPLGVRDVGCVRCAV